MLLALQLASRGYAVDQIATLLNVSAEVVHEALANAGECLGTGTDLRAAVRAARARGLIV